MRSILLVACTLLWALHVATPFTPYLTPGVHHLALTGPSHLGAPLTLRQMHLLKRLTRLHVTTLDPPTVVEAITLDAATDPATIDPTTLTTTSSMSLRILTAQFFLGPNPSPLLVVVLQIPILSTFHPALPPLPLTLTLTALTLAMTYAWRLQEYLLHRFVLHSTTPTFKLARDIHKNHHDTTYYHYCVDSPVLIFTWFSVAGLIFFQVPTYGPFLLSLYSLNGLTYIYTHFLAHSRVKLDGRKSAVEKWLFKVKQNHVRHHMVDNDRGFGFGSVDMDEYFGTAFHGAAHSSNKI